MAEDLNKLELSHHSGSRGFVVVFLLTMALGWLTMLAVNILGNSSNLFPSPWRPAQTERAWKTRRLDALKKAGAPPRVIILGSSRVMQIRPDYIAAITGGPVFNYGVSAANPVDWHAQIHYLLVQSIKPKMIILGIDEFCFGSATSHWQLQSFGHAGLSRQIPLSDFIPDLGEALSNVAPDNTWNSMRAVFKKNPDNPTVFVSKSEYVLADGYMIYKSVEQARSRGSFNVLAKVNENVQTTLKKLTNQPDDTIDLTPPRTKLFTDLLDLCHSNGIETRIMLLPLHPVYARDIMTGSRLRVWKSVAEYLAKTCPEHGAKFWDFHDPASFGGDPEGFWDGQHMTAENDRRMINAMFGLPPEKMARDFPPDLSILRAAVPPSAKKRRRS